MILSPQIIAASTGCTLLRASQWLTSLQPACDKYAINTPLRLAALLERWLERKYQPARERG